MGYIIIVKHEIFARVLFCRLAIFRVLQEKILRFGMTDIVCWELINLCDYGLKQRDIFLKKKKKK